MNAGRAHVAGNLGAGVKVAIIDGGFGGSRLGAGTRRPPRERDDAGLLRRLLGAPEEHGTAVAENVYDVAPAASLYLVCITTEVTLANAVSYVKAQGVDIVVHSIGWFNTSRGDGTGVAGTPDALVADARANGILWVNAAGKRGAEALARSVLRPGCRRLPGLRHERRAERVHRWGGPVRVRGDEMGCLADHDRGLRPLHLSQRRHVCSVRRLGSASRTRGEPDRRNVLHELHRNDTGVRVRDSQVRRLGRDAGDRRLRARRERHRARRCPAPASSSLRRRPRRSPSAPCAGRDMRLAAVQRHGPTIDGRIKPDIVAPSGTSSGVYGAAGDCDAEGFVGTSASAPHVAGLAALLKAGEPVAHGLAARGGAAHGRNRRRRARVRTSRTEPGSPGSRRRQPEPRRQRAAGSHSRRGEHSSRNLWTSDGRRQRRGQRHASAAPGRRARLAYWSPDGSQLAFDNGWPNIANADGSGARELRRSGRIAAVVARRVAGRDAQRRTPVASSPAVWRDCRSTSATSSRPTWRRLVVARTIRSSYGVYGGDVVYRRRRRHATRRSSRPRSERGVDRALAGRDEDRVPARSGGTGSDFRIYVIESTMTGTPLELTDGPDARRDLAALVARTARRSSTRSDLPDCCTKAEIWRVGATGERLRLSSSPTGAASEWSRGAGSRSLLRSRRSCRSSPGSPDGGPDADGR